MINMFSPHWNILDDSGEFVKLYMLVMIVNIFTLIEGYTFGERKGLDTMATFES